MKPFNQLFDEYFGVKPQYKVKYRHYRYTNNEYFKDFVRKYTFDRDPFGGFTVCKIFDNGGNIKAMGVSRCSDTDQFVKSTGRKVAFERANEAVGLGVAMTETSSKLMKEIDSIHFGE